MICFIMIPQLKQMMVDADFQAGIVTTGKEIRYQGIRTVKKNLIRVGSIRQKLQGVYRLLVKPVDFQNIRKRLADACNHGISAAEILQRGQVLRRGLHWSILIDEKHNPILVDHGHAVRIKLAQGGHLPFVKQGAVVGNRAVQCDNTEKMSEAAV